MSIEIEDMKKFFEMAIDNIIEYGDTDIFPYPVENYIFYDEKQKVINLLEDMHKNFDIYKNKLSPINIKTLVAANYTGFRLATQIDPIWNAYLLSLVLAISNYIEEQRPNTNLKKVFSYRIKYDDNTKQIFDKNYGWHSFQVLAFEKAEQYDYILNTDISDFYARIYHHRLENCLKTATHHSEPQIIKNIMGILKVISNGDSYGLPVGGAAARILAECVLGDIDQLLLDHNIDFVRFVDDYYIFSKNKEDAYKKLIFLSNSLINNQGLTLQKSKTRIITSKEFKEIFQKFNFNEEDDDIQELRNQKKYLLSLNLHYDPYSQTAEEDYEKLKSEIKNIDIEYILANELSKTRVHSPLMKKLIKSIKLLPESQMGYTALSLLENLEALFPIVPNVLILLKDIFNDLSQDTQEKIQQILRNDINNSYIFQILPNILYAIRILAKYNSQENIMFLTNLYEKTKDISIKRDIILIFANWNHQAALRNWKCCYPSLQPLEKRAFIIASHFMSDDGEHWRNNNKNSFDEISKLYNTWAKNKKNQNTNWSIDL